MQFVAGVVGKVLFIVVALDWLQAHGLRVVPDAWWAGRLGDLKKRAMTCSKVVRRRLIVFKSSALNQAGPQGQGAPGPTTVVEEEAPQQTFCTACGSTLPRRISRTSRSRLRMVSATTMVQTWLLRLMISRLSFGPM